MSISITANDGSSLLRAGTGINAARTTTQTAKTDKMEAVPGLQPTEVAFITGPPATEATSATLPARLAPPSDQVGTKVAASLLSPATGAAVATLGSFHPITVSGDEFSGFEQAVNSAAEQSGNKEGCGYQQAMGFILSSQVVGDMGSISDVADDAQSVSQGDMKPGWEHASLKFSPGHIEFAGVQGSPDTYRNYGAAVSLQGSIDFDPDPVQGSSLNITRAHIQADRTVATIPDPSNNNKPEWIGPYHEVEDFSRTPNPDGQTFTNSFQTIYDSPAQTNVQIGGKTEDLPSLHQEERATFPQSDGGYGTGAVDGSTVRYDGFKIESGGLPKALVAE